MTYMDFPYLLHLVFPAVINISLITILFMVILATIEKIRGVDFIPYKIPSIKQKTVLKILMVNTVMQLLVLPIADLGSNCWKNCFKYDLIGYAGYYANTVVILLILIMSYFYIKDLKQNRMVVLSFGIFLFLQLGVFDKGLWCMIRISGYDYLWHSFSIMVTIQYILYFISVVLLSLSCEEWFK